MMISSSRTATMLRRTTAALLGICFLVLNVGVIPASASAQEVPATNTFEIDLQVEEINPENTEISTVELVEASIPTITEEILEVGGEEVSSVSEMNAQADEQFSTQANTEPTVFIVATKIICASEVDLPDWANDVERVINSDTAQQYVDAHPGCKIASWDFQVKTDQNAPKPADNIADAGAGWMTFASGQAIEVRKADQIWVREKFQEGFLPFSGSNGSSVSAEIYCDEDVRNYDNYDAVRGTEEGGTNYCVAFNVDLEPENPQPVDTASLHATKIVCDSEEYLPNWSAGADIDSGTVQEFLSQGDNAQHCSVVSGWEFEWTTAQNSNVNPGDNDLGVTGGSWQVFSGNTNIPVEGKVWVREVIQEGYVPFSGSGGSNVSAEMWCSNDVLNYDNWDYVDPVTVGEDYYCVAFNAEESDGNPGGGTDNKGTITITKTAIGGDSTFEFVVDDGSEITAGAVTTYDIQTENGTGSRTQTVNSGTYDVTELTQEGWTLESVSCVREEGADPVTQISIPNSGIVITDGDKVSCTFVNSKIENDDGNNNSSGGGNGGGGGSSSGNRVRSANNIGQVLGATTECSALLTTYLGRGFGNSPDEVTKLQNFLNSEDDANIAVTGIFDAETELAVRVFQVKHWEDVLKPWFAFPQFGIIDSDDSSGIVFKTTKWKINNLYCPGSEANPMLP